MGREEEVGRQERRREARSALKARVRFRIVRQGPDMKVSEPLEGKVRDLALHGISMETNQIVADGLHISYDRHPAERNRIFLQVQVPEVGTIKAVGETVWYERITPGESRFVVGLRFVEVSKEDRALLSRYLSGGKAEFRGR
jgi:hypothetical protein